MLAYCPFDWKNERPCLLVPLLALLLVYAPYWILGQDAYFLIHDFLDDSSYHFGPLVRSGQAFNVRSDAVVPNIMNGLPRSAMHSGLYVSVWLFAWLPSFWAILINFLLVHALGFVSMYVLLRTYVLNRAGKEVADGQRLNDSWLAAGVALSFALIPTYTNYGLSVMGQPLILLAFLNLLNSRAGIGSWLIILLFPFYSFLVRSGLYILVGLALVGAINGIANRRLNLSYWLGLLVLASLYALVDFPMIWAYLTNQFVSHRTEYNPATLVSASFAKNAQNAVWLFIQGQYHAGVLCPIVTALIWAWWFVRTRQKASLPFWLMGSILLICFLHGLYPLLITRSGLPQRLLTIFQLDRFYFLLPLLWTLLLGLLLQTVPLRRSIVLLLLATQLVLTLGLNKEWRINVLTLAGKSKPSNAPSYREFFAQPLFDQIKRAIPNPPTKYRVASIGMHPIVAQENGFYTLDSYQNNYPLSYKHQFGQLMTAEWTKPTARAIRPYFDAYGDRCYVFPAELRMDCLVGKNRRREVNNIQFNSAAFRTMGGRYIFSAVAIKNANSLNWKLVGIFDSSQSYWRVWVYEVSEV